MKISKLSFVVVMLAIVLFSGCELIGDAVGVSYVFDTPPWIRGSWSNGLADPDEDIWTFTATTVTFTDASGTLNWNTYGSDIGIIVSNESSTSTTYEFYWSTIPYTFVQTSPTTFTLFGVTFTKQ